MSLLLASLLRHFLRFLGIILLILVVVLLFIAGDILATRSGLLPDLVSLVFFKLSRSHDLVLRRPVSSVRRVTVRPRTTPE